MSNRASPVPSDWDYVHVPRGELGDPDYSPDAWIELSCEIDGCEWRQEADWEALEDDPPQVYVEHWRERHR